MDEEIQHSIDAFKNRRIFDSFNPEVLAGIADDQIEQVILDFVCNRIGTDFSGECEVLQQLSQGIVAIYTTMVVEAEVDNGGFTQFFWNSEGKLAHMAATGFRQIGALPFEALMRRAISLWEGEHLVWRILKKVGTLSSFSESYKHTKLGELDQEFYRLNEASSLSQQRINYIRQNANEFIS